MTEDQYSIRALLVTSGISGFLLGSLQHGTWQLAIESSQVIAGLVPYARDNPFYLYHSKAWTLLHQIPAIFLRLGFSEKTLSFLMSGLLGMLSFQTLSLCAWILCRHLFLSLACPFVALYVHAHAHFVIYPIWMLGTSNTQGATATFFIILAAAFLALQRYRIGLLLLGVAPAVHLSLGLMAWLIAAMCFLWSSPELRSLIRKRALFFLFGIVISVLSLTFHLLFTYDFSEHFTIADSSNYLMAFVQKWDSHRVPVNYRRTGFFINLAALGLSLLLTTRFRKLMDEKAIFLLRATVAAVLLSLLFSVVSWLPPENIPDALIIMMPARILEWSVVIFPALVVGLLGRLLQATRIFRLGSYVILALMIFECVLHPDHFRPDPYEWDRFALSDHRHDDLFRRISKTKEPLLTGGALHLIQLRTRRPVLLDGGQLDLLPYTLEAAPTIDRILKNIYGIDLENPPVEAIGTASIPIKANQENWESKTAAEWSEVCKQFHVSEVLTYAGWKINLPLIQRDYGLALYHIPGCQ